MLIKAKIITTHMTIPKSAGLSLFLPLKGLLCGIIKSRAAVAALPGAQRIAPAAVMAYVNSFERLVSDAQVNDSRDQPRIPTSTPHMVALSFHLDFASL